jgi:hypothetical protein
LKELPSLALLLVVFSNQISEVASLVMEKGLALAKKIETVFKNIEKALTPMATEVEEPIPQATVAQEAGAEIPGATLFLRLRLRKKDTVASKNDFEGVNALD